MSLSIIISYTPQITSLSADPDFICHRVCYRQNGTGVYCCVEDTTDSTAGIPKSVEIVVDGTTPQPCVTVPDLDLESCVVTEYDGYVQACCEDEATTAGRVYWTTDFTPDPSCVNKLTCCQSVRGLDPSWFVITNIGSGYTPSTTLDAIIVRDPLDTETSTATVTFNTNGSGEVTSFNVLVAGSYAKIPLVVLPPPGSGTQATAILVIPCTDSIIGSVDGYKDSCENTGTGTIVNLLLGECANYCYPKEHPFIYNDTILTDPPDTTNFTYETEGCCDCTTCGDFTVVVSSALANVDICYTECTYGVTDAVETCGSYAGSGSYVFQCVVPGSIYCSNDAEAIVSILPIEGTPTCCVPIS